MRVISQLFWESILIAFGGAVLGTRARSVSLASCDSPRQLRTQCGGTSLSLDWRSIAFIATAAILTSVLFGLSTAIYATRATATGHVSGGARNATLDRRRFSFQRVLMVGQIAISLVLVVGSLLFTKSFQNLLSTDVGFDQDGLNYVVVDFSRLRLPQEGVKPYASELLSRIQAIPGVESAALTSHVALSNSSWSLAVRFPGKEATGEAATLSQFTWISPGYFSTMRIPLKSGRDLTDADSAASPACILVNEQFVRKYLKAGNPVGPNRAQSTGTRLPETLYQIVGVVQDTNIATCAEELPPIAYAPDLQHPAVAPSSWIAVRSQLPLVNLEAAVRETLRQASPQIRLGLATQSTDSGSLKSLAGALPRVAVRFLRHPGNCARHHRIVRSGFLHGVCATQQKSASA